MKTKLMLIALIATLLSGCALKATSEIRGVNGCEVFRMGYPSVNDTITTIRWFEDHNDIYKELCL